MDDQGNFTDEATGERSGANILHLRSPGDLPLAQSPAMEQARQILLQRRSQRVRPLLDDKILTDWNGQMITALARGARILGEPRLARRAQRAADFVMRQLRDPQGRLLHRFRDGEAAIPSQLDDHAFLIQGLLELYEATWEVRHLAQALELNRQLLDHFWDDEGGGLFLTADDAEALLVRQRVVADGPYPSGNAVAMGNLVRISRITGEHRLARRAGQLMESFAGQVSASPAAFTGFLLAADEVFIPGHEVVIVGEPGAPDTERLRRALDARHQPGLVTLFKPAGEPDAEISRIAPYTVGDAMPKRAGQGVCLYGAELPAAHHRRRADVAAARLNQLGGRER